MREGGDSRLVFNAGQETNKAFVEVFVNKSLAC